MNNRPHDIIDRAVRLFGMSEERLPLSAIEHITVLRISVTINDDHERRLRAVGRLPWQECPRCEQSMTGRYNGKHACTRCRVVEGQAA